MPHPSQSPTPEPSAGPSVELVDRSGRLDPRSREWLAERAGAALRVLGCVGSLRLAVVGDEEMARAHLAHCGVEGTTDVITFDLSEGGSGGGDGRGGAAGEVGGRVLDADLLLCADEARRQASARGWPAERELLLYAVHGVLHCLGHDDHDDASSATMHGEEDRVLEAIGVGATYGAFVPGAGKEG
ncbi:MAG: rRNA maturation RNase YbeY [Phycisphaerales bacterium]|nr:rRNA maturation RNase YbeY [Phycisphaerales bacterium]